jgi:predicted dehydrogenase
MEKVRIGLVGAGLIGSAHSAVLHPLAAAWPERVELTAVADPNADSRERCIATFGYRAGFADVHELLDKSDVDVVFICTPTALHAEALHAAVAAGKHIFCEKPLAMSHSEAAEMLAAVRKAGVKAQIGLVLRFSPVYTVMRDILRTADAGAPMAVWFRDDQCFPVRGVHDTPWRQDRSLTAGGTLIEHGVHDLDLLSWMFGPPRRLRATEHNHAGHPGIEDYMAVEIEFASGLRAQLLNVWHDMAGRPSNRRLEIFCPRLYLASDHDMLGDIEIQRGDGECDRLASAEVLERFLALLDVVEPQFRDWYGVAYFVQDLAFVRTLLANRAPTPGLAVGLEAQRLAEAVYQAARGGTEITL